MVSVAGRPFLEHEIGLLTRSGIDEFVLCVGHLGEQIEEHFGDGRGFGVKIEYSFDGPRLLGPAGALRAASRLLGEFFFVTYGDAYLRADYGRIMRRLKGSGALGLMAVYRNDDRYGKSDVVVEDGYVVRYDKTNRVEGMSWINYGISTLRKRALQLIPSGEVCGEEEFYGELISRKELIAFPVRNRFYEIGTPAALEEFSKFVSRQESCATGA